VTTRLRAVTLAGPVGVLEAALQEREGDRHGLAALVCHPHPLYGGTMHNKVVHRIASTLHGLPADVLRFNFRGVGKSEGSYDQGEGELEDARAALAWLRERWPDAALWVAGFSFGSWVAARLAASDSGIERLILVAPTMRDAGYQALHQSPVPKLVVQGTQDEHCPQPLLEAEFARWAEPKRLVLVPGATHFFDRQLGDLARALNDALAEPARGTAA
jgi:alpha/beta superfamily hydrolase